MQSFVLDRHTDPSNPELKISQDDKIPVYNTVADAEAALANLTDGQLIGTKDEREIINAGSARPVTISQSSSINTIQFDTRFVINAQSAITVTLGSALYAGCTVTIINTNAIRHSLAGTFLNNRIPPVMANCIVTLVWTGTAWQMLSYQDNSDSTDETFTGRFWHDNKPIYKKCFTNTTPSTTGWTNSFVTYGDINANCIYVYGGIKVPTFIPFNFDDNTNRITVAPDRTTVGAIDVYFTSTYVNKPCEITVLYTKTTD